MADIDKEKRKVKKMVPSEKRIMKHKALQKAKEIEKKKIPGARHEAHELENLMEEAEKARKMLKPQWYLKKTEIEKKLKKKK